MPAQITLFLDTTGALRAESPGRNGMRNKLDLSGIVLANLPFEIREELLAQQARERDRPQQLARERHNTICEYTAAHHPRLLPRVDPDRTSRISKIAFGASLARKDRELLDASYADIDV